MRAVVIAIKDNRAAVAAEGGDLRYITDRGYVIGQILEIDDAKETPEKIRKRHFSFARYTNMIAAAAVMLIFLGSVTANAAAVSTVTLDVNPSVSYELNVFDRVVGVTANNEDGADLLAEISGDVMFKKLPVAFQITLDSIKDSGLLATEELLVTTSVEAHNYLGINREEIIVKELENTADVWNMRQSDCQVTLQNSSEALLPESDNKNDNTMPDAQGTDGIDNMNDEGNGTESNYIEPSDERDAQPDHYEPGKEAGDGHDPGADRPSEEHWSDKEPETTGEDGHHDNDDDRENMPEDQDKPSSREKHQVPPPPAAPEDNSSDDEHIMPPPADFDGQHDMEGQGNMPPTGQEDPGHSQKDPVSGEGDNMMPPPSQAAPENDSSDNDHMPPPPPPETLEDQGEHSQTTPEIGGEGEPSGSYNDSGEHEGSQPPPPPPEPSQDAEGSIRDLPGHDGGQ